MSHLIVWSRDIVRSSIDTVSPAANPEILCKVFLLIDFGSLGCTLSESAGCTPCNVERFEKFKMAAVSDNSI